MKELGGGVNSVNRNDTFLLKKKKNPEISSKNEEFQVFNAKYWPKLA